MGALCAGPRQTVCSKSSYSQDIYIQHVLAEPLVVQTCTPLLIRTDQRVCWSVVDSESVVGSESRSVVDSYRTITVTVRYGHVFRACQRFKFYTEAADRCYLWSLFKIVSVLHCVEFYNYLSPTLYTFLVPSRYGEEAQQCRGAVPPLVARGSYQQGRRTWNMQF